MTKVLFVNDTSNNNHIGCFATVNTFLRAFERYEYEIEWVFYNRELRKYFFSDPADAKFVDEVLDRSDIVVINGEGSFHSGRSYELLELIDRAIDRKKPFFVLNAFIGDGDEDLIDRLEYAEAVTLRDPRSYEITANKLRNTSHCLDAALFSPLDAIEECAVLEKRPCVTDWHGEAPARTQGQIAAWLRQDAIAFAPMLRLDAAFVWRGYPNHLRSYPFVVTARYHGAVFSALAGVPFFVMDSNSSKMSRLCTDFGIEDFYITNVKCFGDLDAMRSIAEDHAQRFVELRERIQTSILNPNLNPTNVLQRSPAYPVIQTPISEASIETAIDALAEKERGNPKERLCGLLRILSIIRSQKSLSIEVIRKLRSLPINNLDLQAACEIFKDDKGLITFTALAELLVTARDFPCLSRLLSWKERNYDTQKDIIDYLRWVLANHAIQQGVLIQGVGLCEGLVNTSRYGPRASVQLEKSWSILRKPKISVFHLLKSPPDVFTPTQLRSLSMAGYVGDALTRTLEALKSSPDNVELSLLAGELQFLTSDFAHAWENLHTGSLTYRDGLAQLPDRESLSEVIDTDERIVIVFDPQYGVGVAVLFLSIFSDFLRSHGNVEVVADPRLFPVFRRVFSGASELQLTDLSSFSGASFPIFSFMSLGVLYRQSRENFTGKSLHQPASTRHRQGEELRIGVNWSTPNRYSAWYRQIPDNELKRLISGLSIDYEIVSLQLDDAAAADTLRRLGIASSVRLGEAVNPKIDISAQIDLIKDLDAVVGIDCSSSIFASAFGVPTFVFRSQPHSWLWPLGEAQSIFYNTMTFIDRECVDEWGDSLERMFKILRRTLTQDT